MILIKLLSGHCKGRIADVSGYDPLDVFLGLAEKGWLWNVDYSQATEKEIFDWLRCDLSYRIGRAIINNLPIYFLGKKYIPEIGEAKKDFAKRIEDIIVSSGRLITIGSDDEKGLVIEIGGYEN